LREQQKEVNEEWRIYNKRWNDWQKDKKDQRRQKINSSQNSSVNPQELKDFEQLQQQPGQRLSTDDN
ncbi:MAG: hypothetical protein KDD40_11240, partial [Bdellovibrionales bacterium]|nr:hypothetical protein [Bdellovibrionales bacterium]